MTRRKRTGLRGIKRRLVVLRCFVAVVVFSILAVGATYSPLARIIESGKPMIEHKKVIAPAGGILLKGWAKNGGAQ